MPLLLHGDAAFAGQGVVAECFALSGLKGYRIGGTMHFIVNNQIGFTTSPRYSRSSPYPSDVALMVEAPIFHANGDDPEAVVYAAKVATEFRQQFGKDVVIDMFCYRRFGHNEGDDPTFTQPLMYAQDQGPALDPRDLRQAPDRRGRGHRQAEVDAWIKEFETFLDDEFEAGKTYKADKADWLDGKWSGLRPAGRGRPRGDTGVPLQKLTRHRAEAHRHPRAASTSTRPLRRVIEGRREAIDTGAGHRLGDGRAPGLRLPCSTRAIPVRLSGQDTRARHLQPAPLRHRRPDHRGALHPAQQHPPGPGAASRCIDSALSEEAVLGFEYGYSLADPNTLTMWEAQFGDFVNGAQVVIDQFISSGERKWLRMSGLVMLLPHGYEGQGPEHSSARLERFLQLCAEDNMQVANCTTPANYFHILRRQMHRPFRKPLIVMTPKSPAAPQAGGVEPGRHGRGHVLPPRAASTAPRPAATSAASR